MLQNYRSLYSQALGAQPERLHFAAHSHHPWPDATLAAQLQYWKDSNQFLDEKWSYLEREVFARARQNIAGTLGIKTPNQICFAPNTHEFATRILSCFDKAKELRVLTTDGEFYSFARQLLRLEELPDVQVERVPVEPFSSFSQRFLSVANDGSFDLIFFSHAFFNSGFVIPHLNEFVSLIQNPEAVVVVDGYHSFFALPFQLSPETQDRIFFMAGGYKYAQAGEGACFLLSPNHCRLRPLDTGWFAEPGAIATEPTKDGGARKVGYAEGGARFAGATFDPSGCYRLNAVYKMYEDHGLSVSAAHDYILGLRKKFISDWETFQPLGLRHETIMNVESPAHFITFKTSRAKEISERLHGCGVITDFRGDRLRFGFGLYQDDQMIQDLFDRIRRL